MHKTCTDIAFKYVIRLIWIGHNTQNGAELSVQVTANDIIFEVGALNT